ncbi:MAG: cytochrome c oxidase subunit II [Phycisphaerales bacterium]|nr:cytochrome c oxidase subunit II [Phycisphaerales bacterium]
MMHDALSSSAFGSLSLGLAGFHEWTKSLFFFSTGASSQATHTENLFMYIMWINIVSFVALMGLIFYFIAKYHRGKQSENYQVSVQHNTPLELAWSIIPLIIMVPIFYYGFTGYLDKLSAPADAEEIMVSGQKWNWTFSYRNGAQPRGDQVMLTKSNYPVPQFIVPAGRPVKLIMSSKDVIHAFYIPDFRTKMDVIPNRYTSMWFFPQPLSEQDKSKGGRLHTVFCAEYCGDYHSEMAAQMKVVSIPEFEATIKQWTDYNPVDDLLKVGSMVYTAKGCNSCHSISGDKNTGPTWKNMFGDTHEYTNGESGKLVDENWLRENILYSQKRIMKGYPTSMPNYVGQLTPLEVDALIWYIKSLSDKTKPADLEGGKKTVKQYKEEAKSKGSSN